MDAMLVAFSVAPSVPSDPSGSMHDVVADAIAVVRASGLPHHTDAMFTTLEGDWDECLAVVKECCQVIAARSPRVSLVLKADIRAGHVGELEGKVERLEAELQRRAGAADRDTSA